MKHADSTIININSFLVFLLIIAFSVIIFDQNMVRGGIPPKFATKINEDQNLIVVILLFLSIFFTVFKITKRETV